MMTETLPPHTSGPKATPFGLRLQSAREALGLESKDAAAQLRLNEKIILMLETDCYSSDLPATFLRGYIRSYGKLLQIPEQEIKQAIEPIQQKPLQQSVIQTKDTAPVTSGHYFVQLFTYLITFTLIGLVGIWWYTHSAATSSQPHAAMAENHINIPMQTTAPTVSAPVTVKTDAVTASVNLGAKLNEPPETTPPAKEKAATVANAEEQDTLETEPNGDSAE